MCVLISSDTYVHGIHRKWLFEDYLSHSFDSRVHLERQQVSRRRRYSTTEKKFHCNTKFLRIFSRFISDALQAQVQYDIVVRKSHGNESLFLLGQRFLFFCLLFIQDCDFKIKTTCSFPPLHTWFSCTRFCVRVVRTFVP